MSPLEKKFKDHVAKHGAKIAKLQKQLIELSDKTGIPVGGHVPKRFLDEFRCQMGEYEWPEGSGQMHEEVVEVLTTEFVADLCPIDRELWLSSTFECEVLRD